MTVIHIFKTKFSIRFPDRKFINGAGDECALLHPADHGSDSPVKLIRRRERFQIFQILHLYFSGWSGMILDRNTVQLMIDETQEETDVQKETIIQKDQEIERLKKLLAEKQVRLQKTNFKQTLKQTPAACLHATGVCYKSKELLGNNLHIHSQNPCYRTLASANAAAFFSFMPQPSSLPLPDWTHRWLPLPLPALPSPAGSPSLSLSHEP